MSSGGYEFGKLRDRYALPTVLYIGIMQFELAMFARLCAFCMMSSTFSAWSDPTYIYSISMAKNNAVTTTYTMKLTRIHFNTGMLAVTASTTIAGLAAAPNLALPATGTLD